MTEPRQQLKEWVECAEACLAKLRTALADPTSSDADLAVLSASFPNRPGQENPAPPLLPPDIVCGKSESAAVQIKVHLLRARLEMNENQAEMPLSLVRLLSTFSEIAGHAMDLDKFLTPVWTAWRQLSHGSSIYETSTTSVLFLQQLRESLLHDGPNRLKTVLHRQRRAAQLCMAFQGALKNASVKLARELSEELNPAHVIAAARAARPQAKPEDFWRQYEQQADHFTPMDLEQRLTRYIVTAVEELFQNLNN